MKIHEYQAKELFRSHQIPVLDSMLIESPDAILEAVEKLGLPVVVKAQVHAGGRGKGGGVRLAKTMEEAKAAATAIIGMNLVTKQTGAEGKMVHKALAEQGVSIKKELYLSLIVNRDDATVTIMASQDGGMDIEEVAAASPERIIKVGINPLLGIQGYHVRQVCTGLALEPAVAKQCGAMLRNLYRLFTSTDCSLVEINPLIITGDDRLIAL
ncbi:MAG: acetate--CoA ligase family protein, partial [Desulfofustis sp.]|nr:acetate--CoA ligase family protein [Desulfofustis sp.]